MEAHLEIRIGKYTKEVSFKIEGTDNKELFIRAFEKVAKDVYNNYKLSK